VEIFKQVSIDWLSKKWWFFGLSWALIVLGAIGYVVRQGLAYGIDFTGGTVIYLKFKETPDLDLIRKSLKSESATPPLIQRYDLPAKNTVQIRMQTVFGAGQDIESGHRELLTVLRKAFDPEHAGSNKTDFNNVGLDALSKFLLGADPDNLKAQNKTTSEIDSYYHNLAQSLLDHRNKAGEGLVKSLGELRAAGASSAVVARLDADYFAGPFAVKGVESVGAVVGSDLRRRAALAVGLSFLGMLVYIGFRFKPIYGVAAWWRCFTTSPLLWGFLRSRRRRYR